MKASVVKAPAAAPFHSLVDTLLARGQSLPDRVVFTFFDPAQAEKETLTYGGLLEEVKGLAAWLQASGAAGERCLLLFPPGLPYVKAFLACQLAGAVAVPAYFPDLSRINRSLPRLMQMVRDCNARFALTTRSLGPLLQPLAVQRTLLGALSFNGLTRRLAGLEQKVTRLSILTLPEGDLSKRSGAWKKPALDEESLSFLQYTSGSTNDPKGVEVRHGNLMANLHAITQAFGIDESWRSVIWLPPYHDMGLIGGLLTPFVAPMACDLMSPLTFLQRPSYWLDAISKADSEHIVSGGPNFAFDLTVRRVDAEKRKKLDLSRWKVAFCGAEPVRVDTLQRFAEAFKDSGFRYERFLPCYGLAESTLIASGTLIQDDVEGHLFRAVPRSVEEGKAERAAPEAEARTFVSSGKVVPDHELLIVAPETRTVLKPYEVGEVWVGGNSVATGYWNRPERSLEIFHAISADGQGPFLRTGDLGFQDETGRLFISGRLKDMIIVGGRKHYPQDIEATVQTADPALRVGCGAAFSVSGASEEKLVIVQEVSAARIPKDTDALLKRIREAVTAAHDISPAAIVLVREQNVLKTSSGKLQRSATRIAYEAAKLNVVASWSAAKERT